MPERAIVSVKTEPFSGTPTPFGPWHYQTIITDNLGNTYTGYGNTSEEAEKEAGDEYNLGETDDS